MSLQGNHKGKGPPMTEKTLDTAEVQTDVAGPKTPVIIEHSFDQGDLVRAVMAVTGRTKVKFVEEEAD